MRWDVYQTSHTIVRHWVPVVATVRSRGDGRVFVLVPAEISFHRSASGPVYMRGPIHIRIRFSRKELSCGTVKDIEKAIFRCLHNHFPAFATYLEISEDKLLRSCIVPAIARGGLIMPYILAIVGIDGDDRRQEEVVTFPVAPVEPV